MIRRMTAADVPAGMALKAAAGWNQTEADWRLLLEQSPDTCWVEEVEGRVAGSATAVCYGRELAWIGMVLVLPDYRRRGIGRRLLLHAIEACDGMRIKRLALDATDMGRPLYRSLGFVDQEPIERWGLDGAAPTNAAAAAEGEALTATSLELDRRAFGADRGELLSRLAALPGAKTLQNQHGFAMTRPGSNARYLGPVVAETAEAAERLSAAAIAPHRGERLFFDILPRQPGFRELAQNLGLEPLRKLMRMSRPAAPAFAESSWICSAAGFELG